MLHWFTCRRALLALYFSCKEWCWIRCPGRCRCYSLHLGKGLGWDRAFGSLKCWTDSLFSVWPGKKNNRSDANAKKVPHLRGSFLLSAYSSQISALMTLLYPVPRDRQGWLPVPYGGLFRQTKLITCVLKAASSVVWSMRIASRFSDADQLCHSGSTHQIFRDNS